MLTPDGDKPIEQFRRGDKILARPEFDPNGALEVKEVEEVFVRLAPVLHLHVGGQVIGTTAEHPFYERVKGWVAARELEAGDELSSHDGRWVVVEEVLDTGEYATVYNVRVAEYHTYFVGTREWGFSVWAHNQCQPRDVTKATRETAPTAKLDKATAKRVAAAMNANDRALAVELLSARGNGIGAKKAGKIVDALFTEMQEHPRTYETYIKTAPDGSVYIGRASGRGTPRENIARREAGGHDWTDRGYGPGNLDRSSDNYGAIRGREQLLKEHFEALGINVQVDRGISPRNPLRDFYLSEARRVFGNP
jgi:hypothetical protein